MSLYRRILIALFLIINSLVSARTYYVSTTGKNSNPGTLTQPWLSWQYAFDHTPAGDTCYFRGGVYANTIQIDFNGYDGTHSQPTSFLNYPGEKPILDCATQNNNGMGWGIGFYSRHNIYVRGLTIRNVLQTTTDDVVIAFFVNGGSNNITFENCVAHNIGMIGFSATESDTTYFINCDAYNICDTLTAYDPGGGGVGFSWANNANNYGPSHESYTYWYGCRGWNCSDQAWGGLSDGSLIIDNCWAMHNGFFDIPGNGLEDGMGDGFKWDTSSDPSRLPAVCKVLKNCIAVDNEYVGFDENYSIYVTNAKVYNNFSYRNGYDHPLGGTIKRGYTIRDRSFGSNPEQHIYANNISYGNVNNDMVGITFKYLTNHFQGQSSPFTITNADFVSLDTTGMRGPRQADGSLPFINFGKLVPGSDLIDAGTNVGLPYYGSKPDLGWFESSSGSTTPAIPVYQSSVIENTTPSRLEIIYNLSLANIVPGASAFSVMVNTVVRSVNSVAISGTKVLLTLSSPVVYGDVVTVSYTKPAANPLQTATGGQAASIGAQTVTNRIASVIPVYQSSAIENATPAVVEMIYNLALANIVPGASAFSVMVNTVVRSVNSVAISGTKVLLTLSSPVVYGDVVTVSYTKPAANPLQTATGGQAASIGAQTVTNRIASVIPVYQSSAIENATPAVVEMIYNLALANIVPGASAFSVMVNTVVRSVNSVAISGTKVLLTLSSPVVYGDVVTVSYTKPAANPLQTATGGQAASIGAQTVTNRIASVIPVYQSSAIENATPAVVEMIYNLALANIVPGASAFSVMVNTVVRSVNSVAISGTKVLLTLSSPVVYGDVVTVSYTKPAANPLQTATGGQAASIGAQTVTNRIASVIPVYQSSAIENATPAVVEMIYNLALANIVPGASAFSVMVNTVVRSVNSVAISGTKVLLTLSSPVVYGDVVTVSYTKPAANPLQTATGGQAASIGAQTVTNRIASVIPVYQSSAIENATPAVVEMIYNLALANIVPGASAFSVMVNTVVRSVNSVAISGTKVLLTLSSPVVYGDVVTVSYTKPAANPLQTATGGQAASIGAQTVTNRIASVIPVYQSSAIENATPAVVEMIYNLALANIVPGASAFSVMVNTVVRSVNSVAISGTKVLLTLSSPVVYGDVVTVSYTKPSANPLQTAIRRTGCIYQCPNCNK